MKALAGNKLVIKIDGDDSGLKKTLSGIGGIAKVGLGAVTAAAGALSGGFLAATKAGMDFESQMSSVAAISGANADEMAKLNEKAKEMGIVSAYSATEAGKAFEYMALAGWKSEDMLGGISGVMDLAAASGEDLGLVADIVTDGLTAFGLAADQSARFADVLAAAASNSNTNVSMLGEAFKYAAPVAGALGYSIEDTAVALGLMANSGIKASNAGTALRRILTEAAGGALDLETASGKMVISTKTADGAMRNLNDVVLDLRSAFADMTDAQKAQNAESIAGKVGMSGLLAIVNAGDEDFNKLKDAISNSTGAAKEMADIKLDNLKGQITLLGSSLEGLGIAFYEGIDNPLKEVVKNGINIVNDLTKTLSEEGLGAAIKKTGGIFASIATAAAEEAPKMINAAISLIESFIDGIDSNAEQIAVAAVAIGKSLIEGFGKIIPQLAGVALKIVNSFAKELGKAFPVVKPFADIINFLIENLKALEPAIVSAAGAFVTLTIVSKATLAFKAFQTINQTLTPMLAANALQLVAVNGGLSIQQILVGTLTGKIDLAIAKQSLWNATIGMNPIGAAIIAIAALTAAIGFHVVSSEKQTESEIRRAEAVKELVDSTNELTESVNQNRDAYENKKKTIEDSAKADVAQLDYTKELVAELSSLADETGKVDEKNRDRVNFILGEVNKAFEKEFKMIDGQIQGYGSLITTIDELIAKEEERITLKAYEDLMVEAIKREVQAKEEARKATENLTEAKAEQAAIVKEYMDEYEKSTGLRRSEADVINYLGMGYDGLGKRYVALNDVIKDNSAVLQESGKVFKETADAKQRYSDASIAAEKGNLDEIANAYSVSEDTKKSIVSKSANEILGETEKKNKEIEGLEKQRGEKTSESDKQAWGKLITQTKTDGGRLAKEYETAGNNAVTSLSKALDNDSLVARAATKLGMAAVKAIKNALQIKSPSKVMTAIGSNASNSFASGIASAEPNVEKTSRDIANTAIEGFSAIEKYEAERLRQEEYYSKKEEELSVDSYKKRLEEAKKNKKDKSEIAKIEYDEQKRLDKIKLDNLKKDADKANEIRENELSDIKRAYKRKEITEEEYYKRIEKYRDKYFKEGEKEYESLTDDIVSYQKKEHEKAIKDVYDKYSKLMDSVSNKIKNLEKEMQSFQKRLTPSKIFEDGKLIDITKELDDLKEFKRNLERLEGQGIQPEFIDEIKKLGGKEGMQLADTLLKMPKSKRDNFISDYRELTELAGGVTSELYKDDVQSLKKEFDDLMNQLPENMKQSGFDSGDSFAEGFNASIKEKEFEITVVLESIMPTVGSASTSNVSSTTNNKSITQNFYSKTTSPADAYKRRVLAD